VAVIARAVLAAVVARTHWAKRWGKRGLIPPCLDTQFALARMPVGERRHGSVPLDGPRELARRAHLDIHPVAGEGSFVLHVGAASCTEADLSRDPDVERVRSDVELRALGDPFE
jgi:hypothetical protein